MTPEILSVLQQTFDGYAEPLGTRITLHPENTPRARLAALFFRKEMFVYMEQLSSGACGWGICYRDWLEMNGWKLIGFTTFERVRGIEDEEQQHPAREAAERAQLAKLLAKYGSP